MRARLIPRSLAPYSRGVLVPSRCVITLLSAVLLTLVIAIAWARGAAAPSDGPPGGVYTVAGLSDQFGAHPTLRAVLVVRVRAVAVLMRRWVRRNPSSGQTLLSRPLLCGPDGKDSLPLRIDPEDRALGALRRLPIVGALVPPPQAWAWGKSAVYRVQLQTVHATGGATVEAVLLDAGHQDS